MSREKRDNVGETVQINLEELNRVSGGEGDEEDPRLPVIPYVPRPGDK